jgi:hypothetical protein
VRSSIHEGSPLRWAAICGLAAVVPAFAADAASAQSTSVFDPAHWTSAFTPDPAQAADKGGTLEKPREDSRDQKDVFEAKQVEVKAGELREERAVGEYDQPQWTTFRRFPSTRVYLQTPPNGVQFEQWVQFRNSKDSADNDETRLSQELEFGLGHRMQLDLYMNELHVRDGQNSTYEWSGYAAELRYALADWDKIWGNPTLYLEYTFNDTNHDGNDAIEPKLLFGGEIAPGWHWGANLIHERTLAAEHDRVEESSFTASISRTIVDEVFSVGASGELTYESSPGTPTRDHALSCLIGPSFQFLPNKRASLNLEPLFGVTGDSLQSKVYLIFTWHF